MKTTAIFKQLQKLVRNNSTNIMTGIGISGTITTAVLAAKAGHDSAEVLRTTKQPRTRGNDAKLVWKYYVPAGLSGVTTIAAIVATSKIGNRRTAAITAAYSLSEKALVEYREKVTEVLGVKKEQGVRDSIAQDRVSRNGPSNEVIIATGGNVLCCELFTGRYFTSDMETLKKAANELNSRVINELYATLSDWYSLIGLPYTSASCDFGWDSDKLMELRFSTVLSEDGRPCIAFDYNYTKPI